MFSQDYLGYQKEKKLVTDIRYSMLPNQIEAMWGLVIDESLDLEKHALWWTGRSLEPSELDLFYEMLIGKGCSDNEKKI